MKKSIIFMLSFFLVISCIAISSISVGAKSKNTGLLKNNQKTMSFIKYDCATGQETEFTVSLDSTQDYSSLSAEPASETLTSSVSTGEIIVNSIIGTDGRYAVATSEYDDYPHSAVGLYSYSNNSSYYNATAFIVGKRILLTCAHAVYNCSTSTWSINGYFQPHAPAGSSRTQIVANGVSVTGIIFPSAYKDAGSINYDWAILIVSSDVGTSNGTFGLTTTVPPVYGNAFILGYDSTKTMYFSPGYIVSSNSYTASYTCDTLATNSGSPVYSMSYSSYNVFAIHCGGGTTYNTGCRITSYIIQRVSELNAQYT